MDYVNLLQEKGIGPPLLALYAFLATFYVNPSYWLYTQHKVVFASAVATGAVLLLFLLTTIFNDHLMRLLAEDKLASAYVQLRVNQGPEKEFFTDYDDNTQAAINDMDDRTHRAVLAIVSGVLIAVSLLPIGYYTHGQAGLLAAGLLALLPLSALTYPFYKRLHSAIDYAVRETNATHED